MKTPGILLLGFVILPTATVQAGNLDTEFFRQVQQWNTVFCKDGNTGYLSDNYIAFDMNLDGSDVWNASHSLTLIDGRCVHDHDGKGVVSYMYDVDTYVFYKDHELIQLVCEQTQNYNNEEKNFETPIVVYKVNGNEVSKEEGERLLSFVPEGETVDISEDSRYNVYADDCDDEYIFPDSDARYLDESDVIGMSAQKLSYGRNEIYARRGRIFTSQELKDYFNAKKWYSADLTEVEFPYDSLNEYEKYNAKFLKEQEETLVPGGYILR